MLIAAVPVKLLIKIPHRGKVVVAHKREGTYRVRIFWSSCHANYKERGDTALDKNSGDKEERKVGKKRNHRIKKEL